MRHVPVFRRCFMLLVLIASVILLQFGLIDLQKGFFPDAWKKAQIVRIYKKVSKSLIASYRPISILNTIAKLLKKATQLEDIYSIIAKVHKVRPQTQHGFLHSRSTSSNLTLISDFVRKARMKGGQVDVVYTDFVKALTITSLI